MESTDMNWRKSSYSGGNGGSCVEVGNVTESILIRDTKQGGNGPVLSFTPDAWLRFAGQVKRSLAPDLWPPVCRGTFASWGCPFSLGRTSSLPS
jgi:hypothetical protein